MHLHIVLLGSSHRLSSALLAWKSRGVRALQPPMLIDDSAACTAMGKHTLLAVRTAIRGTIKQAAHPCLLRFFGWGPITRSERVRTRLTGPLSFPYSSTSLTRIVGRWVQVKRPLTRLWRPRPTLLRNVERIPSRTWSWQTRQVPPRISPRPLTIPRRGRFHPVLDVILEPS